MDGLAALVRESLGGDPYSGVIYVFRAKRADRVKLLLWDGTGLVLVAKRLEKRLVSLAADQRRSTRCRRCARVSDWLKRALNIKKSLSAPLLAHFIFRVRLPRIRGDWAVRNLGPHVRFCGFRSKRPSPAPFPSMNSMPALCKAICIARVSWRRRERSASRRS